jgi:hypothetical protein
MTTYNYTRTQYYYVMNDHYHNFMCKVDFVVYLYDTSYIRLYNAYNE